MNKLSVVSLMVISILLLCSCEKRYKMVTSKVSSSFGEMQSESEIKAENDSIAYSKAIINFFLLKRSEDEMDKLAYNEGAYHANTFKLYNSDDEQILPPIYCGKDLMILGAIYGKDSTEVYKQICKNLLKIN
ncbi:MAG: hypothetical protein J6M19_05125 [Bacteroidaceae bacterium]|nr:hypothetical protein [Bacteroidaceae bacterium]